MVRFFMVLLLGWGTLHAADVARVDFPISSRSGETNPRFVAAPRQLARPDGAGYTEFYLQPTRDGESLLVTFVFEDQPDNGVSIFWINNATGQQTALATDITEGIAAANQRTILVPPDQAQNGGQMVISGDQSGLRRVRFDWATESSALVAADQEAPRFALGDRHLVADEVTGQARLSHADAWLGDVFEAALQEAPADLAGNLEFVVPLDQKTDGALLKARFVGLPLDGSVAVMVNGEDIGDIHPQIPGLSDPGYLTDAAGETTYAGWRNGAIVIPKAKLLVGDNSIVLISSASGAYVKEATLELKSDGTVVTPPVDGLAIGDTSDLANLPK